MAFTYCTTFIHVLYSSSSAYILYIENTETRLAALRKLPPTYIVKRQSQAPEPAFLLMGCEVS